jgi:hypothetical protein
MSDDEMVRMTVAEIGVMREIVKWRKTEGVTLWRSRSLGHFIDWSVRRDGVKACVTVETPSTWPRLGWTHRGETIYDAWLELRNFTEGVDLLVALGFLPARFSSSYRAGWDARADATDSDGALDLFTWPELAPAVAAER